MSLVGILFLIFAIAVFLVGLYAFTGHNLSKFFVRYYLRNLSDQEWKVIGRWMMVVSLFIFLFSIICFIFHFGQ